jgi:hypothetical protein
MVPSAIVLAVCVLIVVGRVAARRREHQLRDLAEMLRRKAETERELVRSIQDLSAQMRPSAAVAAIRAHSRSVWITQHERFPHSRLTLEREIWPPRSPRSDADWSRQVGRDLQVPDWAEAAVN